MRTFLADFIRASRLNVLHQRPDIRLQPDLNMSDIAILLHTWRHPYKQITDGKHHCRRAGIATHGIYRNMRHREVSGTLWRGSLVRLRPPSSRSRDLYRNHIRGIHDGAVWLLRSWRIRNGLPLPKNRGRAAYHDVNGKFYFVERP